MPFVGWKVCAFQCYEYIAKRYVTIIQQLTPKVKFFIKSKGVILK